MGCHNALTAKIVEDAGFKVVYISGFGLSANYLGEPDFGLTTMTEVATLAGHIADAVDVPVIADADTGYGNPINVTRTIKAFEKAGVSCVHLEDQTFPKRCGGMGGKRTIPIEEMEMKIRAAVEAREDENFLIIARTDAEYTEGPNGVVERSIAYKKAGADLLMPMNYADNYKERAEFYANEIDAPLCVINRAPMIYSTEEVENLGYKILIVPIDLILAATKVMSKVVREFAEKGSSESYLDEIMTFDEFVNFIGLPKYKELEQKFTVNQTTK